MKTLTTSFFTILMMFMSVVSLAQDKTKVTANSTDISDNLDLRAVATIFGDAANLDAFERKLNDPKSQITNLDLNNDNLVDYLRVVESVEGNAHIIVLQAVLDKDVYQDVATIEVIKDSNNRVQVQVVGDVYMYGANYIYEPVYVHVPVIYNTFWVNSYVPYCSTWYWNYYPSYYTCWNPWPIFRYRNHIGLHINFGHSFYYGNFRRCQVAYNGWYGRRGNGYELRNPGRSFSQRNVGYSNRTQLDDNRTIKTRTPGTRDLTTTEVGNPRTSQPRGNAATIESTPRTISPRTENAVSPRENNEVTPRTVSPRQETVVSPRSTTPRSNEVIVTPRTTNPRSETVVSPRSTAPRSNEVIVTPRTTNPRSETVISPRSTTPKAETPRNNSPRMESPRIETPRSSAPRMESPRGNAGNQSTPRNMGGGRR
jgi:hypothetical protein